MISPIINGYADMTLGIFCQGHDRFSSENCPIFNRAEAMKGGHWIILIKGIRLDLELK